MSKIARVDLVLYSEVAMLMIYVLHIAKKLDELSLYDFFRPIAPIMFIVMMLFYWLLVLPERRKNSLDEDIDDEC